MFIKLSRRLLIAAPLLVLSPLASATLITSSGSPFNTGTPPAHASAFAQTGWLGNSLFKKTAQSTQTAGGLLSSLSAVQTQAPDAGNRFAAITGQQTPLALDLRTFHCNLWNLLTATISRIGASVPGTVAQVTLFSYAEIKFSALPVDPQIAPVPLPAAAWLFATGLFGLGGLQARRRRGQKTIGATRG
ncbi:VPLPA-CTERM sorting domain-containing protein [Methylibium sp.]|uniref:VPLPA-CTERM sorting domain-containing protein n=1 Tax=Methylibium sp. TaxID=2067992 RepID=UPI003D0B951C